MLSVQHGFELLCDNNRLPNQLLLSSEIGSFEVVSIKFDEIPIKSNGIRMKSLDCCNGKPSGFGGFSSKFDDLNIKWTYLGAREELDGQTVVAT